MIIIISYWTVQRCTSEWTEAFTENFHPIASRNTLFIANFILNLVFAATLSSYLMVELIGMWWRTTSIVLAVTYGKNSRDVLMDINFFYPGVLLLYYGYDFGYFGVKYFKKM